MGAVATGWPGVFRPLRHHVTDGAAALAIDEGWVLFAVCQSPCWPAEEAALDLPWCTVCWAWRRSSRRHEPDVPLGIRVEEREQAAALLGHLGAVS